MMRAHPKPGEVKKKRDPVFVYRDGREKCLWNVKGGKEEYFRRRDVMWERQNKICPACMKKIAKKDLTFQHDNTRGAGGGLRDDRIEIVVAVNGNKIVRWQNCAMHFWCNVKQGSKRIVDHWCDTP